MIAGVVKTKVLEAIKISRIYVIPACITTLQIENVGVEDVYLWFQNADKNDGYRLKAGDKLPVLTVEEAQTVYYKTKHDIGQLQLLMWG